MNIKRNLTKAGKAGREALLTWQFGLGGVALIVGLILSVALAPASSVAAPVGEEPCVACAVDAARYNAMAAHYAAVDKAIVADAARYNALAARYIARSDASIGASAARWNALAASYDTTVGVSAPPETSIAASSARWNALAAHYVMESATCGR